MKSIRRLLFGLGVIAANVVHAQTPPGDGGGCTNSSPPNHTYGPPDYGTNLWLEATNMHDSRVFGLIHNSSTLVPYGIFSKQSLTEPAWSPEAAFYGSGFTTNVTPFALPVLERGTLFLRARSLVAPRTIGAGVFHNVALKRDGTVWAWGVNDEGELGNGQWTGGPVPVRVVGLSNIVAVAVPSDGNFTLALDSNGTVWSWGQGWGGQLGRSDGLYEHENIAAPVPGLSNMVAITGGYAYSIALKSDGTVWAWGAGWSGQLGDGTQTERDTPAPVFGLTNAIAISSGADHNFALCADGTVWGWGGNWAGQLGIGNTDDQWLPVMVGDLTNVVALSCGYEHSLALLSDGTVEVWGFGGDGELGDGTYNSSLTPVPVPGLSNVTAIACGDYHNLALDSNGALFLWGAGYEGQLGDGSGDDFPTPFSLDSVSNVVAIAGGGSSTVVLTAGGQIYEWGQYSFLGWLNAREQFLPFMYDLYDSLDSDDDGLPDWFEAQIGTSTNNVDGNGYGISDYEWFYGGFSPANPPQLKLGFWTFDTTNWLGEAGQTPITFINLQSIPDWSGSAVHIGTNTPAWLTYREVETNISTIIMISGQTVTQANYSANITLRNGTIQFWFNPDWSSVSAGGTGPGTNAALIVVGNHSPDFSNDFWGLEFNPAGDALRFSSEGGRQQYVYCDAPISFSSNQWYHITLTYDTNSSVIYTNGQLVATGGGVQEYPGHAARQALGFNIGSTSTGDDEAFGLFDNLETFNYPMNAADVNTSYYNSLGTPLFEFPPMFVESNTIALNFHGALSATVAVLVNDPNFADAVAQTYTANPTIQVPVNLGSTDGVYIVSVGIWNGIAYNWTTKKIVVDTVPPQIVPAGYSMTTNSPLLQLTGYSAETLSSITFDLINSQTTNLNQTGFVVKSDGNTFAGRPSTNWFQCFDIILAPGLNTIVLRCADLGGNVSTNGYFYTLNTSSMTPPTLSVDWPPNGTIVSGNSITVKGHVSDPTAKVVAQVALDGSTNNVTGVVERDGTFWIDNVPVTGATNSMTITAMNVAGQSVTNALTIQSSPVNITVDPMSGDALKGVTATVTGTIDSGGYDITVNGVSASISTNMDGSIHWQAANAPVSAGGVATFRVKATQGGDPELVAAFNKPTFIRVSQYNESLNFDWVESLGSVGSFNFYVDTSLSRGRNWVNGVGGSGSSDYYLNGIFVNANITTGPCQAAWQWPAEQWPPTPPDGSMTTSCQTEGSDFGYGWTFLEGWMYAPAIPWQHVDFENPAITMDGMFPFSYLYYDKAQTRLELVVGGRAVPGQPTMVTLKASAAEFSNPSGFVPAGPGYAPALAVPQTLGDRTIAPPNITIANQACVDSGDGTNGFVTLTVPSGVDTLDITPVAQTAVYDCYSFDVTYNNWLAVDNNRDGQITFDAADATSPAKPFRFWINDSKESGDISSADNDVPGLSPPNYGLNQVNGRSDLINFFPVALNLSNALQQFPLTNGFEYHLSQANGALKFVYTSLTPGNAFDYLTDVTAVSGYGVSGNEPPQSADTIHISPSGTSGTKLDAGWLAQVQDNGGFGVILMEGSATTTQPFMLEIWQNGNKLEIAPLYLSVDGVENMYRWVNLRHIFGLSETWETDTSEPGNFPDALCNGKQFVFVHGYSVNETAARGWSAEMFKRLYQTHSHAMFTAVTWFGNDGQLASWVPFYGGATPDYYTNVANAFLTASNLALSVNQLPGQKYIAAHSLGNMLVSSAIADWNLNANAYFMIDAAVAMEAYDSTLDENDNLRHPQWTIYSNRVYASDWHKLFDSSDGRSQLTWNNRFGSIANAYNYYSSTEDVLAEADGSLHSVIGQEFAWVNQEMRKGRWLVSLLATREAGWGFNNVGPGGYSAYSVDQVNSIAASQLQTNSFFRHFNNADMYSSNGGDLAADFNNRAHLLGDAIPAMSNATGANDLGNVVVHANHDMNNDRLGNYDQGLWPISDNRWHHSNIIEVAYPFNHAVFNQIITDGGLR